MFLPVSMCAFYECWARTVLAQSYCLGLAELLQCSGSLLLLLLEATTAIQQHQRLVRTGAHREGCSQGP